MRSFFKKEVKEAGNLVMEKFRRDKVKYLTLNSKVQLPSKERSRLMDSAFLVAIRTKFGWNLTAREFSKVKSLIGKELRNRRGVYPKSPMSPPKRKTYVPVKNVENKKIIHSNTEQDLFPSTIPTHYY